MAKYQIEYQITKQLVEYTKDGFIGVQKEEPLEYYDQRQEAYDNYFKLKDNYTDFVVNSDLEIGKEYYCYAVMRVSNYHNDILYQFYMGVE